MSTTIAFLEQLLRQGEAVMPAEPAFAPEERPAVVRLLETAYGEHRLEVAGPLLPFDADAAVAAARFLGRACWQLVNGTNPGENENASRLPLNPKSAEAHLSADLCLRYLATVYRRVRIRAPDDALHRSVIDVLCRWPLSGAATDVPAPPIGDLQFGNHYGLQLLYAERLAANLRAAWIPAAGRTRQAVELVLFQQGKNLPASTNEGATE